MSLKAVLPSTTGTTTGVGAATPAARSHVFRCAQCDLFVTSASDSECAFHSGPPLRSSVALDDGSAHADSDQLLPCACTSDACASGPHRPASHTEYPYSDFFSQINSLLDTQKIFTVVAAEKSLAIFGLTDNFHPTHPSHLFLYVTPNGREHPSQRVLFFSAHHLAFVALRASMSVMYSAGSKENVLRVVNILDKESKSYVDAVWILNAIGGIIGIQITCQASPNSTEPAVTNVYFSQDENLKFGLFSVNVLSTFDAAPSPTPASPTPKVLRRIGRSATDARSDLPRAAPTVTKEFHVLACVQCGADFLENDNFAYSCRFHKLEGGACCLKGNVACTSDAHRANHHTEYPYAAYATYVKEFFKFDHEVFGAVESQDVSYEPTIKCSVRVGVTCASHSTAPSHLFIFFTCGPSLNSKHLQLFDRDELTSNAADLELLIGRYEDADNVVEASWIVEDEQIIGIQMFAKSATMQRPSISRVLFEFESEGAKVPSVSTTTVLSESHFGEKANPKADTRLYPSLPFSAATYTNEDAVLLGIPKPRPPEKFQPVVKKGCPLKISFVSVDCFRSNPALGGDQFLIVVDIINDSLEPVKINEFICYWKIRDAGVDAAEWVQAKIAEDSISKSLDGWSQIAANKWATLKLFINVGKSGVVRIAPVLFDVELHCDGGSSVSLTVEHTADQVYHIPEAETDLQKYIVVESPNTHSMLTVDVYRKQRGIDLLSVNMLGHSHKLTLETARRAVIISERNPELGGVVQVLSEPREEYKCQLNVFALVDSAVRRVYAFRINVTYEGAQAVRFLPVDAYGDALALNPIVASRAIEAPRSTEGLETFKVRRSLVFRDQPLIPFTPRVVPKFVPYVAQNEAAPVASVDTVEQAVLNLLEKRLADFVAKVTPSPQPAKADDTKLDLILAKLSQMDARMTELETQQAAHAQAVSEQLKQTVLHVENIACHSAANESAVEEVLVNVQVALESHNATREDAALLESLIKRLEVVGIDADELTAASSFQNEDIMALNNLTRRLENLGASADELSTSIKGIAVSATKESAVVAKDANVEQITIALESWNERMERLEGLVALPDVVSKSLQEIMMRQAELDADIRSSGARNPPEQLGNTNIMHKLSDLEMRIEMLPQSYKLALDLSLERQTDSLLAVLDERIETGRPLSPPTSPNNNGGTNNTKIANRLSQMRLGVPNMGIASTVQKLSGLVSNRNGGESPIQGGGSENSAIPLLEGN